MNNTKAAQYVILAEASYADLTNDKGNPIIDKDKYFNSLKESEFATKDTDGQIAILRDNWDVVANWKDRTDETSFSATLFQNKNNDGEAKYVLAFKGSKEAKDFFVADGGDIILDCFALNAFYFKQRSPKCNKLLRHAA